MSALSICLSLGWALGSFADDTPFWKSKTEVYRRIKEERAVIVSAKSTKNAEGKKVLQLITAGRISAPLSFTHKILTDYSQYHKVLPYVDETSLDKETNRLFATGSFMGLHAKMTLKLSDTVGAEKGQIEWDVLSGFLTGMKGVITEERVKDDVTEISMDAKFDGKAPVPGFLMNWGFEFIGQKMASAMRKHVEDQWEKETSD